jgi:CarboxypepD_reg-like domain/TonB-dependent Receptor Plug Domain
MKKLFLILFTLWAANVRGQFVIEGQIFDSHDSTALGGVVVQAKEAKKFVVSNDKGRFLINKLKAGNYTLTFKIIGYESKSITLSVQQDSTLTIFLSSTVRELDEVVISSSNNNNRIESLDIGVSKLSQKSIKEMPSLFGEKDVMKTFMLTPGVKNLSEGSVGMYVRGGSPDQNLTLMNNIPVFGNAQLLGFVSTFNTDMVQSAELYKGNIPAKYGGRLSSILDVSLKKSNLKEMRIEGSIGILSMKVFTDLPIVQNKIGLTVGVRYNYFDVIKKQITVPFSAFAYDITANLTAKLSDKNVLNIFAFTNADRYEDEKTFISASINYADYIQSNKNQILGIEWASFINQKVTNNFTVGISKYDFGIKNASKTTFLDVKNNFLSTIQEKSIQNITEIKANKWLLTKAGFRLSWLDFQPANLFFESAIQSNVSSNLPQSNTFSQSIFIDNELKISQKLKTNLGFRLTRNASDTATYSFEPRLSLRFLIDENSSLKIAYTKNQQPLHLLTNPGLGTVEDIWVPSTKYTPPQNAELISLGYSKVFEVGKNSFFISSELYYKKMKGIISYKDGYSSNNFTIFNADTENNWENIIARGQAYSYGWEIFLEKNTGKFKGWIGYTLSWTRHQFEELNNSKWFDARYDRRHDVSVVASYKPFSKITFSANWTYGTGQAITLPINVYFVPTYGTVNTQTYAQAGTFAYGNTERNSFRMRAVHRLDFSMRLNVKHKWGEGTWEFGLYNVYNQANPFYYYLGNRTSDGAFVIKSVSLFPMMPMIGYSFRPF